MEIGLVACTDKDGEPPVAGSFIVCFKCANVARFYEQGGHLLLQCATKEDLLELWAISPEHFHFIERISYEVRLGILGTTGEN